METAEVLPEWADVPVADWAVAGERMKCPDCGELVNPGDRIAALAPNRRFEWVCEGCIEFD